MTSRDLAGCPLAAAFAEAQRAIKKQIARKERIAFSPTNSLRRGEPPQAIQRKDANRLDFIPPKAHRKTASSIECFQVHVIKVEGIHGRLHVSRGTCRVRVFQNESPSSKEGGAGNAGHEPHPRPRLQNEKAHDQGAILPTSQNSTAAERQLAARLSNAGRSVAQVPTDDVAPFVLAFSCLAADF